MRARKQKKQQAGAPKWMVTFTDLITLILVFFILLFSMSQIDIVKFKAVAESFNKVMVFDFYPSVIPLENPTDSKENVEKIEEILEEMQKNQQNDAENQNGQGQLDSLGQLLNEVNEYLEKNGLEDVITANRNERGVVLVLQEKVLYRSGEAEILDGAKPFLAKVGALLSNIPNPVKVEGHTDNVPMYSYKFPSNWELSAGRASSVVRYLTSEYGLDQDRFTIVGYGETRPIVKNDTKENRQKNRRVEIVIEDPRIPNSEDK